MERGIKSLIGLLGLLAVPTTFAGVVNFSNWDFKPNSGVDVGVTRQRFQTGYGEEQFRRNYPNSNIYAGVTFLEWLGLEVGYEHIYELQKRQFYSNVTGALEFVPAVLGYQLEPIGNGSVLYFSDMWGQGWHADLIGVWPVCKNISLTASIGASWMKFYYETVSIGDNDPATRPERWNSSNQAIARVAVGVRQMINDYFGLRLQGTWENTSKLHATVPVGADNNTRLDQGAGLEPLSPSLPSQNYTVEPKNNYSVTLGFFLQFC